MARGRPARGTSKTFWERPVEAPTITSPRHDITIARHASRRAPHHAHIHTAYFVWKKDFEIFWLSDRAAKHSRNVRARPSTAITVFDSHQV